MATKNPLANLDAFMEMYKKTKAPEVRTFLKNLYDSAPEVYATNGIVVTAEVREEVRSHTPARTRPAKKAAKPNSKAAAPAPVQEKAPAATT